MARNYGKPTYHRNYRLRKVRINAQLALGALAAGTVIQGTLTNAATDPLRFISIDGTWSILDLGAAIDDGFTFGVAHSDYSAVEIEECLESFASMDLGDKVAQERQGRLVREIGTISVAGAVAGAGATFNDGKPMKTRLNWLMSTADQLGVWVRNASGVVWTTGARIAFAGNLWVKD